MPNAPLITSTVYDAMQTQIDETTVRWYESECAPFDVAVQGTSMHYADPMYTIWDEMPTIDSKVVVSLLTQLEPLVGVRLPVRLIKAGGYDSLKQLRDVLLPKIRDECLKKSRPGLATTFQPKSAAAAQAG